MLDQTINDTSPALDICPKCELSVTSDERHHLAYCFICRRGDLDAGRAIPVALGNDGGFVHRLRHRLGAVE